MADAAYWKLIEPYWEAVDIYDEPESFLEAFREVPNRAANLLAVHWCQSEVCNGGLHQFFSNATGVLAPEAALGFEALGLTSLATVLRKAMAVFPQPYPRDQEERTQFLDAIPGESRRSRDPFVLMDNEFFALIGDKGDILYDAADSYALASDV